MRFKIRDCQLLARVSISNADAQVCKADRSQQTGSASPLQPANVTKRIHFTLVFLGLYVKRMIYQSEVILRTKFFTVWVRHVDSIRKKKNRLPEGE